MSKVTPLCGSSVGDSVGGAALVTDMVPGAGMGAGVTVGGLMSEGSSMKDTCTFRCV